MRLRALDAELWETTLAASDLDSLKGRKLLRGV
jgi:hypothetical protein